MVLTWELFFLVLHASRRLAAFHRGGSLPLRLWAMQVALKLYIFTVIASSLAHIAGPKKQGIKQNSDPTSGQLVKP
ncbi:hypothetical protein GGR58DRAFT_69996 [Xylaria digitata]|nr:hypothetical protein GGR58DRAFT_69996 [Xylaria digitata]